MKTKYIKLFESFNQNESFETEHSRRDEDSLTESQERVVEKLVDTLNEVKPDIFNEVELYQDGTIIVSYIANVTDWMDLTAHGERIRMSVDEIAILRPIFLQVEGVSQDELKRMVDLGLVEDLDKYINLDGEYITGFNISIELTYTSKDVSFEHTAGDSASEYYNAEYLDLNSSAPQDYETVAENLLETVENWFNETALREQDLQEMLDEQFPEEEEDEEDDEENNDEDED